MRHRRRRLARGRRRYRRSWLTDGGRHSTGEVVSMVRLASALLLATPGLYSFDRRVIWAEDSGLG